MESFRIWQENYRREVEDVLAQMRAGKLEEAQPPSVSDLIIPPAAVYVELGQAKERLERLGSLLKAARARLELRAAELSEEARRREELKELAMRLRTSLQSVGEEFKEARRQAVQEAARAQTASEERSEAVQDRKVLAAELEAERSKMAAAREEIRRRDAHWTAEARRLETRIAELQHAVDEAVHRREDLIVEVEAEKRKAADAVENEGNARQILDRRENFIKALQERLDEANARIEEQAARAAQELSTMPGVLIEQARLKELLEHREDFIKALQHRFDESDREHEARVKGLAETIDGLQRQLMESADRLDARGKVGAELVAEQKAEQEKWKDEALGTKSLLEASLGELQAARDARVVEEQAWRAETDRLKEELEIARAGLEEARVQETASRETTQKAVSDSRRVAEKVEQIKTLWQKAAKESENKIAALEKAQADIKAGIAAKTAEAGEAADAAMRQARLEVDKARADLEKEKSAFEAGFDQKVRDAAKRETEKAAEAGLAAEAAMRQARMEIDQRRLEWEKEKALLQSGLEKAITSVRSQAVKAQRVMEDTAAAQLASDKQRLRAHWEEEAKIAQDLKAKRAAQELERQRILAETQADLAGAEESLRLMPAAELPAAEKKPEALAVKSGVWAGLTRFFRK
jgi:DNA repair exonuclease SbcCD ATPase subunit